MNDNLVEIIKPPEQFTEGQIALHETRPENVYGPDSMGFTSIQFCGFEIVLMPNGRYFLSDTSGG